MDLKHLEFLAAALQTVLQAHGVDRACSDATWLQNILADYSPQTPALNRVAALAAREGVPAWLTAAEPGQVDGVVTQAVIRLVSGQGIDSGVAHDAVLAWARALGLSTSVQRVSSPSSGPQVVDDEALCEWRELFWWTMRREIPRRLDIKGLEATQRRLGLADEAVERLRASFGRDVASFRQAIVDACEDGTIEEYEAGGLEEIRLEACISTREAVEVMRELALPVLQVADDVSLAWLKTGTVPTQSALVPPQSGPLPPQSATAWRASWMQSCGEDTFGRWAAVSIAGVEHKFRWCPPGKFLMGSPATEAGRFDNEGPQHEVELTQGFWIGEAPVTQRQWEAVAGSNPSDFKGLDLPVEQVSWFDCEAWMSQANARTGGLGLRFPTEAEWEYAARAGTTGATYRGGNDATTLDAIAWYNDNSDWKMHPVMQKAPNAWGLFGTLGGVWEWCADSQRKYANARAVDPHGGAGLMRVDRGGSWDSGAQVVRAAIRWANAPDYRCRELGFRLARGQ